MKRTARNILTFLPTKNGQFCVEKLPPPITYPESEREKDLAEIIDTCERRKKDLRMNLSEVHARNHHDITSAISGLADPLINLTTLMSLLMACIIEMDHEVISMRGEIDALELDNQKLKQHLKRNENFVVTE